MPVGAVIILMLITFAIGVVGGMILQLGLQIRDETDAKRKDRKPHICYTVDGEAVSEAYAKSVWSEAHGSYVMPWNINL